MNPFTGRVAIVTGGASGIGRAVSEYLGRHGAVVVIGDLNLQGAMETAGRISGLGGCAEAFHLDAADEASVTSLIRGAYSRHGRLDYLFNNAGISVNGEFKDISDVHWRRIMDVNLWGVVAGCRCAYPIMISQGFGHIINTASLAGLIPGGLTTAYSTSKHAVVGFSLSLRSEARLYGIRVSALCPGYIHTGIQAATPNVSAFLDSARNKGQDRRVRHMTAEDCVGQIMRGVKANRGIIFSPKRQKIYWWMNRLFPEFIPNMFTSIIARLKRNAEND